MSVKGSINNNSHRENGEKYKCKKKTRHIRLNIIDSRVGQNSPEWTASTSDPLGSYTGVPENRFERPVQDADDL